MMQAAAALPTSLQNYVISAFSVAATEINGEFGSFGVAIMGILLSWHMLLGAAELAAGDAKCRFLQGAFWVRILTVFAILGAFETIFMTFAQGVATSSTAAMVAAMSQPWAAAQKVPAQVFNNFGVFLDTNTGGMKLFTMGFSMITSLLICGACVVTTIIGFFAAAILMLVQGYIAITYCVIILIMAPIMIPFGFHESTESMAWSYVKGWLVYGIIYMPMLVVAMNLCSQLMLNASITITSSSQGLTADTGSASLIAQYLSTLATPLAVIGIVFVPNAALNKIL